MATLTCGDETRFETVLSVLESLVLLMLRWISHLSPWPMVEFPAPGSGHRFLFLQDVRLPVGLVAFQPESER